MICKLRGRTVADIMTTPPIVGTPEMTVSGQPYSLYLGQILASAVNGILDSNHLDGIGNISGTDHRGKRTGKTRDPGADSVMILPDSVMILPVSVLFTSIQIRKFNRLDKAIEGYIVDIVTIFITCDIFSNN
ncbi:MAG: hypothetical protein V2I35_02745 [Desulfocapsaceae bacterium]|nr:hypothetical protein [Desulfocapsaceae bacterium]